MLRAAPILRVAELIRTERTSAEAATAELPTGITAYLTELPSGILVTLQHRRRWWDLRPRAVVLAMLNRRLTDLVERLDRLLIVAAVIVRDGMVLAAQRSHPAEMEGLWEFPGGKLELGESPRSALVRECYEELGVGVAVGDELGRVELPTGAVLIGFWASLTDPAAEPRAIEHRELRWCQPSSLPDLVWLATNRSFVDMVSRMVGER